MPRVAMTVGTLTFPIGRPHTFRTSKLASANDGDVHTNQPPPSFAVHRSACHIHPLVPGLSHQYSNVGCSAGRTTHRHSLCHHGQHLTLLTRDQGAKRSPRPAAEKGRGGARQNRTKRTHQGAQHLLPSLGPQTNNILQPNRSFPSPIL